MQNDDGNSRPELFRKPTGREKPRKDSPISQKKRALKTGQTQLVEGAEYKVVNGELRVVKVPKKPVPVVVPNLKLTPGLFRSMDGRKVQIWYVNKGSPDFPAVGAIEVNGVWEPRTWSLEGWAKKPFGSVNNIVAPWSEL